MTTTTTGGGITRACDLLPEFEDAMGAEFTRAYDLLHAYEDAVRAEFKTAVVVLDAMRHGSVDERAAALQVHPDYKAATARRMHARNDLLNLLG